jgi:hypothetical protein
MIPGFFEKFMPECCQIRGGKIGYFGAFPGHQYFRENEIIFIFRRLVACTRVTADTQRRIHRQGCRPGDGDVSLTHHGLRFEKACLISSARISTSMA